MMWKAHLEVVDCTLRPTMMTRIVEIPDVDDPNKNADSSDDLGQDVAKIIDLLLQRRLLADLRRDGCMDISEGGKSSRGSDQRFRSSIDDSRSLSRETHLYQ